MEDTLLALTTPTRLLDALGSVGESLARQNNNMETMQSMALTMGHMLTAITEEQQRLRHEVREESASLKRRLEALEEAQVKAASVPVKNVDSSGPLRYALRYLMTAGMDTRTGVVCAFPVMYGQTCNVMISLHLLKFSFNRIFKTHSIKDRSLAQFINAFSEIDAIAPRDTVERAAQVLPILPERSGQKNNNWVKLPAVRFVELCMDLDARYPIDSDDAAWSTDHLWRNDEPNEIEMPVRMRIDTSSADNYSKRAKMAWNVPVWKDILETEAVRAYVRIVADAKKEEVPDTCHFSGIELFPAHTVEDHPRKPVRRGKCLLPVQKAPRHAFQAQKTPQLQSESESEESESEANERGEEEHKDSERGEEEDQEDFDKFLTMCDDEVLDLEPSQKRGRNK